MKKIAFLFAGQGAQTVGMGKDLYETFPVAKAVFDSASPVFPEAKKICFEGDGDTLTKTENTQPCLFLTDLAIAKTLQSAGVEPSAVAGFSLGEIPAAAFSGVMTEEEAFRFVLLRGRTMAEQSALHPGAMAAALKLDEETVNEVCSRFPEIWAVNYNCPGQISCAGNAAQIDDFCAAIKAAGGRAVKLPVSGAFHTPYMNEVSPVLREFLEREGVSAPKIPFYANRTASVYPAEKEGIVDNLSEQVRHPVLWEKTLKAMKDDGIEVFIEVGAGSTLTKFVSRTLEGVTACAVNDVASFEAAVQTVKGE